MSITQNRNADAATATVDTIVKFPAGIAKHEPHDDLHGDTTLSANPGSSDLLTVLERLSLVGLLLALSAFAFCRIDMTDTPWHLATARLAWQSGAWPSTNTFSYTHPEYPIFQQYPVYQSALYAVYTLGGFVGLSLFHGGCWLAIFWLATQLAGGGISRATKHLSAWTLVLLGLQLRMTLRPDLFSLPLFMLTCWNLQYLASNPWRTAIFGAVIQGLFANSHQLWPFGIAIWLGAVGDAFLCWLRNRKSSASTTLPGSDQSLPSSTSRLGSIASLLHRYWPSATFASRSPNLLAVLMGLVGSLAACLTTPIGWQVWSAPFHTFGSLSHHRFHVQEFAYIWHHPYDTSLCVIALIMLARTAWNNRTSLHFWELGAWLITLVMAVGAVRGAAFFIPISVCFALRIKYRADQTNLGTSSTDTDMGRSPSTALSANEITSSTAAPRRDPDFTPRIYQPDDNVSAKGSAESETSDIRVSPTPPQGVLARFASLAIAVAISTVIIDNRWLNPTYGLGGSQPGLGQSLGWWPNDAIAFIRRHQPAGKVMNLSWYTGNALIFELFPKVEIFVDPRFEAYPRSFLLDAINAPSDPALFDRLAAEHDPGWLVLESRDANTRKLAARLSAEERFTPIYADTVWLILVDPKQNPQLAQKFAIDLKTHQPTNLDVKSPRIRKLQEEAWQVYQRDFIAQ